MTRQYRLISADGHVVEPPDMWTKYLPQKFHDRAPKLVKDAKGGDAWELVPGTPPMPLGLVTNAGQYGKRYEDLEWYGSTYDSILKGAFEGKARVEEQDFDGVDAEVLFPSQRTMGAFMAQDDDDYHLAGLEAYNTWMHDEFMAASPERLIGLAQMPGVDIQSSVKWLRDAKAAGYRGVIISAYPSGHSELSAEDDAFWEAAEEEQMPIHIHSGLRQAGKRTAGTFQKAAASAGREIGLAEMGGPVGDASGFMSKFIYSGIYDRFPALQCVAVECGAGWVPHFLEHMDDHYWRNRTWTKTTLKMTPSEYFRRNWKVTFIREPFAVATRHWIGVDNLMWSTDYPHHRHDWPYSRRIVEESMGGVPDDERRRMCCENARELYRLG
jgi:predicted TIM-barrel fold metal-dependent hydrolase